MSEMPSLCDFLSLSFKVTTSIAWKMSVNIDLISSYIAQKKKKIHI